MSSATVGRENPSSRLAAYTLHDRAFDRGLITVNGALKLTVSRRLEAHLPDDIIDKMFVAYRGTAIRLPEKFRPQVEFLAFHREAVFVPA